MVKPLSHTDQTLLGTFSKGGDTAIANATFLAGIDLEGYGGVNENKLLSGTNTYAQDVFFHARFGDALGGAYELTWIGVYEAVIKVENR